jgi:sulfatase modifying factor 1
MVYDANNLTVSHSLIPDPFPPSWVSDWGEDEYGLWIAFIYKGVRQAFRWIPPGRFMMGSPHTEAEREDNETQHEVSLTEGYWLGDTVVTQALWEVVTGENPSHFKGPGRPVERVSWHDAVRFMRRLNAEQDDLGLRFPTEAEWEHGCRAGTQTPFSFGETITTDQVNYNGNYPYAGGKKGEYREETVEVKALPANSWGLYQMHGNVWEWCYDWYGDYPTGPVTDPRGPKSGVVRVLRGGGWDYYGRGARSARRGHVTPDDRDFDFGFRLARGPKGDRPAGGE